MICTPSSVPLLGGGETALHILWVKKQKQRIAEMEFKWTSHINKLCLLNRSACPWMKPGLQEQGRRARQGDYFVMPQLNDSVLVTAKEPAPAAEACG